MPPGVSLARYVPSVGEPRAVPWPVGDAELLGSVVPRLLAGGAELKRAVRRYQRLGLVMLKVDAWTEPLPYVRRHLRYDSNPYRILVDPTQGIPDVYNAWKTPTSAFIHRVGKISSIYPGLIPYDTLVSEIQVILVRSAKQKGQP